MGFCSCTVKFILFLFNIICALVGLIILGVSIYLYLQNNSVKDFSQGHVSMIFIIMMVLGGVTFIISFLGCCGAVNEDPCCITTYGTLLSAVLICQIAIAGYSIYFNNNSSFQKQLLQKLQTGFEQYDKHSTEIDVMQRTLQCCGYNGPSVWNIDLPASCCPPTTNNSNKIFTSACTSAQAYQTGCGQRFVDFLTTVVKSGATTLFVVGFVELLCIICAFWIANSIRKERISPYSY